MIDVDGEVDVDTEASPAQSQDDDTADIFFAVQCAVRVSTVAVTIHDERLASVS